MFSWKSAISLGETKNTVCLQFGGPRVKCKQCTDMQKKMENTSNNLPSWDRLSKINICPSKWMSCHFNTTISYLINTSGTFKLQTDITFYQYLPLDDRTRRQRGWTRVSVKPVLWFHKQICKGGPQRVVVTRGQRTRCREIRRRSTSA